MEQHIIRAITEGSEIADIDGSFKEKCGTTAVIIEVNYNVRHRTTVTPTSPGTAKDQYTYRSDLTGIYHVIYIIYTICEKHKIRSGVIMVACDGFNAIKNPWTPILHICVSQITSASPRTYTINS